MKTFEFLILFQKVVGKSKSQEYKKFCIVTGENADARTILIELFNKDKLLKVKPDSTYDVA